MPLIDLWKKAQKDISSMSAQQILAIAGDGVLRDNSVSCFELREFLSHISILDIEKYAHQCLSTKFQDNGFFLQDIVNELGKRLEYEVINGVYHGAKGKVGHDGTWISSDGHCIVVEVKSSTIYSIDLHKIIGYRQALAEKGEIQKNASVLIVVGSEDTAGLEAQIRGSRYAWDIRLISVDALIKLVKIKEATEEDSTAQKIRSLLVPVEYTKLDSIVDIMFTTSVDIEESIILDHENAKERDEYGSKIARTDDSEIDNIKQNIVRVLENKLKTSLHSKSKALYWNQDGSIRVFCAISKHYSVTYATYWYTLRRSHREFLYDAKQAFIAFGCTDTKKIFLIPAEALKNIIDLLNQTRSKTGNVYWHVCISENPENHYSIVTQKDHNNFDLSNFIVTY